MKSFKLHYQEWLKKQTAEVKKQAPKNYIGDKQIGSLMVKGWFALSANQISKDAPQLDIYLTTEQTKILQPEIYQQMF
jgi:hypothetical protein